MPVTGDSLWHHTQADMIKKKSALKLDRLRINKTANSSIKTNGKDLIFSVGCYASLSCT